MSWMEAEDYCSRDNSHLVSVLSRMEEAYVHSQMKSNATAWIGLSNSWVSCLFIQRKVLTFRFQNEHIYQWSDGWFMDFSLWGQEPHSNDGMTHCAVINGTDGRWYPDHCSENRPFFCKYAEGA